MLRPRPEPPEPPGAEILIEPAQQDYGGSNYIVQDPEGNVWSFGSHDPWADG